MEKLKVVFDDGCPTCTLGKNMSERLDTTHSIEFIGMNTEHGKRLITANGLNMTESAYAIQENTISGKSEMARRVLAHNGIIGAILSIPFRIPWLSDKFYDVLALHRRHVATSRVD